jgi:molybdopterin-guanine dinucleotide biosynthesis protein A
MWSAAILTGGRAVRFDGRDKGALIVGGRTILERQLAELSIVTRDILIVGGDAPRDGARLVPDLVAGCGPLGGLHAALTAAANDVTFLVACDMPYITSAFAAHLAELTKEADAVVPYTERGYHPLCAAYTRACLEPVTRRLLSGQLQMTALLDEVRLRRVTAEEIDRFGDRHRLLANVNTPAEYIGLEALHSHEL